MIIFAEIRALFASPGEDYRREFGCSFNNNKQQQDAGYTSGGEKTLQEKVSDVTIEAQNEWGLMANSERQYWGEGG